MGGIFRRLLLWVAIVVALYAASQFFDEQNFSGPRRPMPPEEGNAAWLNKVPIAPPTGRTPTVPSLDLTIEDSELKGEDAIGTAFLVAPDVWVTAAHVIENCKASYIRIQGRWRKVSEAEKHRVADVAVLKTAAPERPPMLGVTDRLPVLDQEGFHVGYLQGVPSTVYTRFVGLTRIRGGKPGRPVEQGWTWAELDRRPATTGTLGGLSGGPQVDRTGAVQGVTILHSERIARVTTTPVRRVREIVPETVPHALTGGGNIDRSDFARHGEQARQTGAVSLVFCSVSGRTRPRQ